MPWNNWVIRRSAGTNPPVEWEQIVAALSAIGVSGKNIDKIEYTAFVKKGNRIARWMLPTTDPEYCTMNEALEAGKKLTWLMLFSDGAPAINATLTVLLSCKNTPHCQEFQGHEGACRTMGALFNELTTCQLCKNKIRMDDFDRDARKDSSAVQIGHRTPLSRGVRQHKAINISWAHRDCNQIQGEQTLDEALQKMKRILGAHGLI